MTIFEEQSPRYFLIKRGLKRDGSRNVGAPRVTLLVLEFGGEQHTQVFVPWEYIVAVADVPSEVRERRQVGCLSSQGAAKWTSLIRGRLARRIVRPVLMLHL